MESTALYRPPNTRRKHPAHPVYPYLLKGLTIDWANLVWSTYILTAKGFVYLYIVLDGTCRKVLAPRGSASLDAGFCVAALEDVFERDGLPERAHADAGWGHGDRDRGKAVRRDERG